LVAQDRRLSGRFPQAIDFSVKFTIFPSRADHARADQNLLKNQAMPCPNNARASQAEFAVAPANNLTPKPPAVSWEVAGALFAAAGGVGSIAVQLAKRAGATVLGIAGPSSDDWLSAHGIIPVNYGDNLAARLRVAAPHGRISAFLDFFGGGYVKLAVTDLGVPPRRVNTVIDFPALVTFPVKAAGSAANAGVLAELAKLIADGDLEIPIAAIYPSTRSSRHIAHWNSGIRWAKSYFAHRVVERAAVRLPGQHLHRAAAHGL
jgi:NADPH:quinone reductase-like Zn-dependent oxidoreductase